MLKQIKSLIEPMAILSIIFYFGLASSWQILLVFFAYELIKGSIQFGMVVHRIINEASKP